MFLGYNAHVVILPTFESEDLDTIEKEEQFNDSVMNHSEHSLNAKRVSGMYACSQCLYSVTEGQQGQAPQNDIASLPDVIDRCLVRCIIFALDRSEGNRTVGGDINEGNGAMAKDRKVVKGLCEIETKLRKFVKEPISGVRILPYNKVSDCRRSLVRLPNMFNSHKTHDVVPRTMEKRIREALASKNIHLRKLSTRSRCYIIGGSFERPLSVQLSGETRIERSAINEEERCALLDTVGKQFQARKESYWNGDWSLNDEIASIPSLLWRDYSLQMCSRRKRNSWRLTATASDCNITDLFLVSNARLKFPKPSLESALLTLIRNTTEQI